LAVAGTSPELERAPACASYALEWRYAALWLAAAVVAYGVAFAQTIAGMAHVWNTNATFSHGYLVLPIALILVWNERRRLLAQRPRPEPIAVAAVALFACVWLAGELASVRLMQHFAAVAVLTSILVAVLGPQVARVLLAPLAVLWFAVPAGESLVSPLQDFTGWFAVQALRVSGLPVLMEGRIITVPGATWEVAEACSGIRYLVSSVMVGLCVAHVAFRTWKRRTVTLLAFITVPIIANAVRAYGIIMLGYLSNNRLAHGVDHIIYGWVFFSVIIFGLTAVVLRWREQPVERGSAQDFVGRTGSPVAVTRTHFAIAAICCVLVLLAGGMVKARAFAKPVPKTVDVPAVRVQPPWMPAYFVDSSAGPKVENALAQISQRYEADERSVDVFVAVYPIAGGGVQMIAPWNVVTDQHRWIRGKMTRASAEMDGVPVSVNETEIRYGHHRRLIWSFYFIGGRFTGSGMSAKYLQAQARLKADSELGATIFVTAPFGNEAATARNTMQDFLRKASLRESLQAIRTDRNR